MNKNIDLYQKFSWLKINTPYAEYVTPNYYDRLLKPYIFENKTDIEILKEFLLNRNFIKNDIKTLELGCGTGRATKILLENASILSLRILDLSKRMIDNCKKRFSNLNFINYTKSSSIDYISNTNEVYDFIFSLWSFSDAVHQVLVREGIDRGKAIVQKAITKMFTKNMATDGKLFIIHIDSKSDEQHIVRKEYKRINPIYSPENTQSLSKLILDKELARLKDIGLIDYEINHYVGEAIKYNSEEEALEIFMNFHLESRFNQSDNLSEVLADLSEYFKQFTNKKGEIFIKPGCFIYTAIKK